MIVLTYGKLVDFIHLLLLLAGVGFLAGIKYYTKRIFIFLNNLVVMEFIPEHKSKAGTN